MKARLKIAERMALGFGLMLLVLAAFAWVIDRQAGKIERSRHELISELGPLSDAAERLELRVLYLAIAARSWLLHPSPEALGRLESQLGEARASLLALEPLPRSPDTTPAFEKASTLLRAYLDEGQRFVGRARANEPQPPGAEQSLAAHREEALEALRAFSHLQRAKMDQTLVTIQAASAEAERVTSIGVAVALLLFMVLAVLTVRSVREPAQSLVEIAQRLEQGDWTPALQLAPQPGERVPRDELGILSNAFGAAAVALERREQRLKTQAQVLAEEDERKTEFLGVLAHELRNPLAAISNSLFALTHAGGNPALRERAEQVIGRQSKLLARLIDDLLDVTRINSGKIRLERERVDLAAVLRAAVEDCRASAERAGTQVELRLPSEPAIVNGDPMRLQQVLGNLIDNAIKFGGEQHPVAVSLVVNEDRSTEVRVVDEGVGIAPALLSRLFLPFSQADTSVQRHRSGLGLGLALVKALVELHGGTVSAASAGLGHGAQFCVRFPPAERDS